VIDREALRKKWENHGKDLNAGGVRLSADKFYALLYYYPKGEPGAAMTPVITFLPFNSPSEAMEYIVYYYMPEYSAEEKTARAYKFMDEAIKEGKPENIKNAADSYNVLSGINNPDMPAIDRMGGPADIISSAMLLSIISLKRVKIKHAVLKALMDIKKFDDKNDSHLKLAEKFLNAVLR